MPATRTMATRSSRSVRTRAVSCAERRKDEREFSPAGQVAGHSSQDATAPVGRTARGQASRRLGGLADLVPGPWSLRPHQGA